MQRGWRMNGAATEYRIAVLHADISGSTRLYERYGDAVAQRDIALGLRILSDVAGRHGGRVLETIGDEVVCAFGEPRQALAAARDMHEALSEASAAQRFESGSLKIKIGWHYGPAKWRGGVLTGATRRIAAQIITFARAEEVLTSAAAVAALPDLPGVEAQRLDTVESAADGAPLTLYKIVWQRDADVTQFRIHPTAQSATGTRRLRLRHNGREWWVDANHRHCTIGRTPDNDIATGNRFTSRRHAEVSWSKGLFRLADRSINGTLLAPREGPRVRLHREDAVLCGSGVIACGGPGDPAVSVAYDCV